MSKQITDLPDYETLFPEQPEAIIKTSPRRSQRIKSTGIPARLKSRIRSAQEKEVQFHIDVSTRFQYEKDKLLNILPLAKLQDQYNLVIPYQPTELQLTKIYTILPIDIHVTAISCPQPKSKTSENRRPRSQFLLALLDPDYQGSLETSDSQENLATSPPTLHDTKGKNNRSTPQK